MNSGAPGSGVPTRRAARVNALFERVADSQRPSAQRGRDLEDLAQAVFSTVPGVSVLAANSRDVFACQEIDVVLENRGYSHGLFGFDPLVLIECKNWDRPVGSMEVAWFDTKLRLRGLKTGILLTLHGITGDTHSFRHAQAMIAMALVEGRRVVVIDVNELRGADTGEQLARLCRRKLSELHMTRGLPVAIPRRPRDPSAP